MSKQRIHEPGIYIGMPEAEYHADPSLSSSGIRNLQISPLTFWVNSPFNPDQEPDETEAKTIGKAFHKRILEGEAAFNACYAPKLSPEDVPHALKSGEELRAHCKALALKASGTLAEMSERIREVDKDVALWTEIEEPYLQEHEGKEFIPQTVIDRIKLAAASIAADAETAELFANGFPEVSIFWIDERTGIPMKARLDFLTLAVITDVKTFSNSHGKPLHKAIASAIAGNGYGIQAVTYMEAVKQAKAMIRKHGVFAVNNNGVEVDADWWEAFAKVKEHRFAFLFVESGRVPNVALREFDTNTNYYDIWVGDLHIMLNRFRECLDRWGKDQPWCEPAALVTLLDEDLPLWTFN